MSAIILLVGMKNPAPNPALPDRFTSLEYVLGVLRAFSSRPAQEGPSRRSAEWFELLFAVLAWVEDGDEVSLSTYLGQPGAAGEIAWASLCEAVGRPLVMRAGRSFEASLYAFPLKIWVSKGSAVGRLRLDPRGATAIQQALAGAIGCKKACFCPEILPIGLLQSLSYYQHLHLTRRMVAGQGLPAFMRRGSVRLSPGPAWCGVLVAWHDALDCSAHPCGPPLEEGRLRDVLCAALPGGLGTQILLESAKSYLTATRRPVVRRKVAGRRLLTRAAHIETAG